MVSRDKPAAAEYGARRAGLAGRNRELQAPRESVAVLDSSLERDIFFATQLERRTTGVFRGKENYLCNNVVSFLFFLLLMACLSTV